MSKTSKIKIADIAVGDVFSEVSQYKVDSVGKDVITFIHQGTKGKVQLGHAYVEELLSTADQYSEEKTVNKEDSTLGDGIRTIFENIGNEVFTVVFTKQGKAKTQKAVKAEKDAILGKVDTILKAKKAGAKDQLVKLLADALDNPIVHDEPGEDRLLRGYKIQHTSRDGKYNCVDMDIDEGKGTNVRPVNINTIKMLVVNGVKYSVK